MTYRIPGLEYIRKTEQNSSPTLQKQKLPIKITHGAGGLNCGCNTGVRIKDMGALYLGSNISVS